MKNTREVDTTSKGERIKSLREAKELSQAELAKLLNTKRQTISKYENGIVTNIPSDRIEEMARILDTTPEYILGWEMPGNEEPATNDGLSDSTRELIEFVRANISEDKAPLALRLMKSIAESD